VVSFTHRPLYPHRKSPWYPLDRKLDGPQSRSGRGGEEKNSKLLPGLEPPTIQSVAQRYMTELSRILLFNALLRHLSSQSRSVLTFSSWFFTAKARLQSQGRPCIICWWTGRQFPFEYFDSLLQIITVLSLYTHLPLSSLSCLTVVQD
jgi:hypothetical protein